MPNVVGRYHDHTERWGFLYLYTCPECGREFKSSAPELSEPALCHGCYTGDQSTRDRENLKGRRGHRKRKEWRPDAESV